MILLCIVRLDLYLLSFLLVRIWTYNGDLSAAVAKDHQYAWRTI